MEQIDDDILEKAALWDTLCVLREANFQWLLTFFWSEDNDGPSYFGYGLALVCKIAGSTILRQLLGSPAFLIVAESIRKSQELGGHPIQWKSLFTLWLFASRGIYESVLRDEKEMELLILEDSRKLVTQRNKEKAIDRAKQRVRWARDYIEKMGYPVKKSSSGQAAFYKLIQAAERELSASSE